MLATSAMARKGNIEEIKKDKSREQHFCVHGFCLGMPLLKRIPEQRHREEALLVVVHNAVGAAVIALVEDVLVVGEVLQVQR